MYKLVICDDEGKTTIVPLIRDEVSIGRKEGNTIRLTDRNVSRFHARVIRQDETFLIEDLGSMCGTKVNSDLLKSESANIKLGDKLSIGDYSLSIRTDVASDVPLGRQMEPGDQAGIGKVTPHARLVILTSPEPGQEIELTADLYVIGRSQEANCRIKDSSVSRAHARVDLDAGEWTISDLDSVHGIEINGVKKDDYVLKPGDIIKLGAVQFRYVAPGEPYDYDPSAFEQLSDEGTVRPRGRLRSYYMLYALGIVAVVSVIAIIVAIALFDSHDKQNPTAESENDKSMHFDTFESLIENGKDQMQAEEWAGAAKLFALALDKKPNNKIAREMKQLSIKESEAQKSYAAGLAAGEIKNWRKAVDLFGKIPRSSHYYDIDQLKMVSGRLCSMLLKEAGAAASSGKVPKAMEILNEIGGIPEAPADCRIKKEQIRQGIQNNSLVDSGLKAEDDKGAHAENKPVESRVKTRRKDRRSRVRRPKSGVMPITNPYESSGDDESDEWDPVSKAHSALRQGDTAGAIAILKKGGNSRAVLALLCRLYMKAGDQQGYESTARKFIHFYPNDPKAEEFKRVLSR
ncbi:MAG: FHA domain-containing protein [Proteobacteria bacterium]|nr:FHA domain-containing protein [Pseudomonadota bacterium]